MLKQSTLLIEDMIKAISTHEVFRDIEQRQIKGWDDMLSSKSVEKNKKVFEIGDQPNMIYYLLSGSLTLKFPDNSKLKMLPGQLIGEIGVLNGDFRLGTLTANEDSQLIGICGKHLFNPNYVKPEVCIRIIRSLSKRVTNYLRSIQQTSTQEIISHGESEYVEFKSSLRWNLKANKKDKRITHAILKTIAGFINSEGGILLVGVDDDGNILGIEQDRFENEDKLLLFLTNVIKSQLGTLHLDNIHYHLEKIDQKDVLRIDVNAGNSPCYLAKEDLEHFYIRTGPATTDLRLSKVFDYIYRRFGAKQKE